MDIGEEFLTTAATDPGYPLDTNPIPNLDAGEFCTSAQFDNCANAFMPADLAWCGGVW